LTEDEAITSWCVGARRPKLGSMPRKQESERVLKDLGRRVAELRDAKRLTQERFAARAGWSTRYQQYVEAGRANLSVAGLVNLANLLGVETRDLLAVPASRPAPTGRPRRRA
jgi:ribosome-binding protein aMBF1 (putative translation factor)